MEMALSNVTSTARKLVEVPLTVLVIPWPETTRPPDEESPPPATASPPLVKVEVAELVFKILPALRVKP